MTSRLPWSVAPINCLCKLLVHAVITADSHNKFPPLDSKRQTDPSPELRWAMGINRHVPVSFKAHCQGQTMGSAESFVLGA